MALGFYPPSTFGRGETGGFASPRIDAMHEVRAGSESGDSVLPAVASPPAPLLVTTGLTKHFSGVRAVDGVDLTVRAGEILALLGPNGAGKSTLIQILAGVHPFGSYEGTIALDGQPFAPASVAAAEVAGIVFISQEVNVVPDLTVGENLLLNHEPARFGFVDRPALFVQAAAALRDFAVEVEPRARMGSLDLATQQLVVIARALSQRARLLILDEPTAALTEAEAQRLFARMRALRERGVACIFVSHRLAEVFAVADRILVMRDGRLHGDHRVADTSREAVVAEMIGGTPAALDDRRRTRGRPALEIEQLTVYDPDEPARARVDGIGFSVREGEILGLFGLLGAGCGTAARAIFGAWPGRVEGRIRVGGNVVSIRQPADAIARGLGLIAQDRREALVHDHSIADNIALASLRSVSPRGFLDLDRKRLLARRYVELLQIRTPSVDARVATLSGGNQQKVQVARWLAAGSRVLLLVDPTRGVDVGARAEINRLWQTLAAQGFALLLVSSEAEELVAVCERILVMRQGKVAAEFAGADATVGQLLRAAAGV